MKLVCFGAATTLASTTPPAALPHPCSAAARPELARSLLAFDAKAGMAGIGMAGGYGVNGANVMQGVMARVSADAASAAAHAAAAAAIPAAAPDVTIPGASTPAPRFAGRKLKL